MPSEFVQRQVGRLLDQASEALDRLDWPEVRARAQAVLDLDPENQDAPAILAAAERAAARADQAASAASDSAPQPPVAATTAQPTSFANGRYVVKRFLGEGGKKKVYLAHDSLLDRDVAFALIKTEGLDEAARERITREAQAMGRLGAHPHIVTVFDIGSEGEQPYLVLPVLAGGDVEGVIEKAPEHKVPIERAIKIAVETCLGLEFVHAKGIVHRDLKPGNVWLTEDGRAMIGDFGLAVATDRTRLTQAGMMVGTVSYMPPEQAMGGEITPRSDLYALGAMLYEMVCGRPPFVGDESVAIIGQHLNTPPVAPTWHRPDCPPALEVLILRLLEKDPSKRPESAKEVREALTSVTTGPRPPTVAEPVTSPHEHDPLYRRTFVGRENEVKQLQQAFDAAMSGNGALVMVVGEPGIGKTALCEQLATYVALRGGKALVGHCYEEGSLSLPYLAFVEAMRSYVLARDPEGLRSDLGTGAADVARIVSEVRDRVQGVELRPAGDPEDDRWRLLQAITGFLRNASTVQPLAIVLEDLHWADRGTLDLLLHVARNLQGARLLIVGTYRDVEVDRAHPLSGTLAELRRQSAFSRVPLRGLTVDEVHRMYETLRGGPVPWAQAELVHRQTEGNPLFIQEFLRYLVEEGYVVREGGHWVPAPGTVPGTGLPEGLRDVVGKRLSRLSERCNRLLSTAAVIGRDFDLQTLRGIANLSEEDLLTSIEEAVRFGVLEERSLPGALRYRFAHAFFRTALYEEMIAARRLRLHQEVARALEAQYASRREEHAAELAEHYGQSTDRADLAKAVEYSELAAKRAMAVSAYAEAENHLRRCLEVQAVLDPDDNARRCELLIELVDAILPQRDVERIAPLDEEAFGLATRSQNARLALRVAMQALDALRRQGLTTFTVADLRRWIDRTKLLLTSESKEERILVTYYEGINSNRSSGEPAGMHARFREAMDLAFELDDDAVFFRAAGLILVSLRAMRDEDLRRRIAGEIQERSHAGVGSAYLGLAFATASRTFLENGDRAGAEAMWRELSQLADRTPDFFLSRIQAYISCYESLLDGHLDDVRRLAEEWHDVPGSQVGFAQSFGYGQTDSLITLARYYQGLADDEEVPAHLTSRPAQAARALQYAFRGSRQESITACRSFANVGSEDDETSKSFLASLFEASVLNRDLDLMVMLRDRFRPYSGQLTGSTTGLGVDKSVGRFLGEASVILGEYEEAKGFYESALSVSERVRFRPEIALIRLDLAELLLEHYPDEREAAIEHLDFAIAEFTDMKMQPSLERALRHRGLLKA